MTQYRTSCTKLSKQLEEQSESFNAMKLELETIKYQMQTEEESQDDNLNEETLDNEMQVEENLEDELGGIEDELNVIEE